MDSATASRPPQPDQRRGPRWWWIALVQVVGTCIAAVLALIALFSLPKYGFFGVQNDAGTRATGALAALGALVGLFSGPIFVGLVRRDRSWLRGAAWVAAALAVLLVPTVTG